MKNKKNIYTSPSLKILTLELSDVISTSGFNGTDHDLRNSVNPADINRDLANTDITTFFSLFNAN